MAIITTLTKQISLCAALQPAGFAFGTDLAAAKPARARARALDFEGKAVADAGPAASAAATATARGCDKLRHHTSRFSPHSLAHQV